MDLGERRRHSRFIAWQSIVLVPFTRDGSALPVYATLVDISEGGALVDLGEALSPGQPVALYLRPGPGTAALRARVVRVTESVGYLAHLRFLARQTVQACEALDACLRDARASLGAARAGGGERAAG